MPAKSPLWAKTNAIVKLYKKGHCAREIADVFETSETLILKILKKAGVSRRSGSEVANQRWSKMTAGERFRHLEPARRANKNRTYTKEERNKRAQTIFDNQTGVQKREKQMLVALAARKQIKRTPLLQYNVGPYNIDLAFPKDKIAIELQYNDFGTSSSTKPARIKYLVKHGWHVLLCYCARTKAFDFEAIADFVTKNRTKIARSKPGFIVLYNSGAVTSAYDSIYKGIHRLPL